MANPAAEQGLVPQLRRIAEIPAFSQHVGVEASEAADCLEAAIPFLRARAASCEACEGAGERIVGHAPDDYQSEPCKHCKPIWDLIERIEPPGMSAASLEATPPVISVFDQCEKDADCCLGKDHTGDCDDLPF
jgi:hypothetical protein